MASTNRASPASPYMAAYFASIAAPNAPPASSMPRRSRSRPVSTPTSASTPADQHSSSGVSVEITKLPSAMLGSVIQMIAAIHPAAGPASQSAARHSTSDVARCSQGAGNRTAHS